jgi:hypothetical protein
VFSWRESNADFADCPIMARGRRLGRSKESLVKVRAILMNGSR